MIPKSNNWYLNNPLTHADRKLGKHKSAWVRSFACNGMKPLIICRGPIRKEAMDVFDEMGISSYGILLSEKDSITYTNALAPELRKLTEPHRVHRVPDYTGASKEERSERIQQIIRIANDNGYDSIFAGYGFMAEDEEMVKAMELAGLNFIGPCSATQRSAGLKDEAKRTALAVGVSVTPGIDNATALTLLGKYPDAGSLRKLVASEKLQIADSVWTDESLSLADLADEVLAASYEKGIDLLTTDELGAELERQVMRMYADYPKNRIRLKAIAGGGGKGQRILPAPTSYDGDRETQIRQAAEKAPALVREILAEVKCNGVGDNRNILAELNIETTRHNEIQVVGNGDWCITMGGRDCSLQMHEQKLLEVSVTVEELQEAIAAAESAGRIDAAKTLACDLETLEHMEEEATRFGQAVGLNSVSTFECIVDGQNHFFMEMNTRIQVEHRVTELCYVLKFTNPEDPDDYFVIKSLVEAMVLLACHGKRLPKPVRIRRMNTSVEARLNATNQALQPHAGGVISHWSNAIEGEIRDDQGISMHNPDTGVFMKYHLAGAYDSNIALLLTTGADRRDTYQRMAEILREARISGSNLCTNLEFHYGLVSWFIGQGINARPTTRFIVPYLTAVGRLKREADNLDIEYAYGRIRRDWIAAAGGDADKVKAVEWAVDRKHTLLLRPIERMLREPHVFSGWLSINRDNFAVTEGKVEWRVNPVRLVANTYHFLNMDYEPHEPALNQLWDHDRELLGNAVAFYDTLVERTGTNNWGELQKLLTKDTPPKGFDARTWQAVIAAHEGYQCGTEILLLLPYLAAETGFFELKVNPDLSIHIPDTLLDADEQAAIAKVLVPPPMANSDEIVATSGGMFYPREAPGMALFVNAGDHFNEGDPLYIVEVMKMFNKVYAPFSGTIEKVLVDGDGMIIKKGDPLFKITPDEEIVFEKPENIAARKRQRTDRFLETNG